MWVEATQSVGEGCAHAERRHEAKEKGEEGKGEMRA
jgi:hypothetical protein